MRKYRWLAGLLAAVWLCLLPAGALATGAEPPHVTILVQNGPKDLRLALRISDGEKVVEEDLESVPLLWDQYFQWYGSLTRWTLENWYHMGPAASQTLLVQGEGVYLEIPLDGVEPVGHSNMVTLDVAAGTLTPGEPFWRIPLKIGVRIAATLLIEGLVFWLFRYRARRSWAVFLAVNLLTQAWLNYQLLGTQLDSHTVLVLLLLFIEPAVFVAELIALCALIKEKKRWVTAAYTVAANLASLALGWTVIGLFPV